MRRFDAHYQRAKEQIDAGRIGRLLHRTFNLVKKLAGITRRFRIHDLRHSFASRLVSRNVNLGVISKAMGHTTIAMTMRYARPSPEALRDIQRALDA